MRSYRVALTRPGFPVREARDIAPSADAAARAAERRNPGYSAVLVVERYRVRDASHALKAA